VSLAGSGAWKVLIVDDDGPVRDLVALELEGMGFTNAIQTANGRDALRLLTRKRECPDHRFFLPELLARNSRFIRPSSET